MANVRCDGLAVVLGPLLDDPRISAAILVDVDSGMVLDAWSAADPTAPAADLELIGAQHAEILRCGLALLRAWPPSDGRGPAGPERGGPGGDAEVVLGTDDGCRHLLRTVPDPHGDRLALAVVVDGPPRVLDRVRKRLRAVAVDALTAGPSMTRRPVRGRWSFAPPAPEVPASPEPLPDAVPADPVPDAGPTAATDTDPPTRPLPIVLPGPRGSGPDAAVAGAGFGQGGRPSPPAALPAPALPAPVLPAPLMPVQRRR